MEALLQDLRYVLWVTLENRWFSAVVILTLALAIGASKTIFGAVALTRVMTGLLYGMTATDPLTPAAAAAFLGIAALIARCLPARRAARVDPMIALRSD